MPKYLYQGSYTAEGVKGLLKEGGTSRKDTISKLLKTMGMELETMYFGFGTHDIYAIVDAPDHATAIAASLVVNAAGAVAINTTVLVEPSEIDAATKITVPYRPPGQ